MTEVKIPEICNEDCPIGLFIAPICNHSGYGDDEKNPTERLVPGPDCPYRQLTEKEKELQEVREAFAASQETAMNLRDEQEVQGETVATGTIVLATLRHWHTKNTRYAILEKVDSDDEAYRIAYENAQLSHDWDIVGVRVLATKPGDG